jgi:FkbM family methyltransferase
VGGRLVCSTGPRAGLEHMLSSSPSGEPKTPTSRGAGNFLGLSASGLLHCFYHRLARSGLAARTAVLIRNQLDAVIRYHFSDSFYRADQMDDQVLRLIGPSVSRFMDVGANVGRWSLTLLRHAPSARGVLLEPSSASEEARRAVGRFPMVTVCMAAAGDREGVARFFESSCTSEGSTLVEGAQLSDSVERSVPIVTVDAELARLGWGGVDVLKVDTEGFDLDVLRGAEVAIHSRSIRWIQFEYNVHWRVRGSTLFAAERLLKGYKLYVILPDGLHRANVIRYGDYFAYSNYLAVRDDGTSILAPLIRNPL